MRITLRHGTTATTLDTQGSSTVHKQFKDLSSILMLPESFTITDNRGDRVSSEALPIDGQTYTAAKTAPEKGLFRSSRR